MRRVLTSLDAGRAVLGALEEAFTSGVRCVVVAGPVRAVGGEGGGEAVRWLHRLLAALERVARKIPMVVAELAAPSGSVGAWIRAVQALVREVFEVERGQRGSGYCGCGAARWCRSIFPLRSGGIAMGHTAATPAQLINREREA